MAAKTVIRAPRGSKRREVKVESIHLNKGRGIVMSTFYRVYPEICQRREIRTDPDFPVRCPICGSAKILSEKESGYRVGPKYGCGGQYTKKSQIQTHTDKWWGQCQKK